jgi:iron(III) transport system ATP-binding protein
VFDRFEGGSVGSAIVTGPPAIDAAGVHKAFGATAALRDAALTVEAGQLVALLGPSGSGKTTMLRVIAGLEVPDAGEVSIGGRVVVGPTTWVEPEQRHVGMVFQDGALFPHLSVAANVAFGGPRAGRVEECLELVGLADRARSYPHELSGGERQRVALARALAPDPEVVLLDEPFAALDAALRTSLREEVARILRDAGTSALLVTHDQEEALSLADVVVVMRDGGVLQVATPEALYQQPASRWVAEFVGTAEVVAGESDGTTVHSALGTLPAPDSVRGPVDVIVRPESLVLSVAAPEAGAGQVVARVFYGHDEIVAVALDGGPIVHSRARGGSRWLPGQRVDVTVDGAVTVLAREE